MTPSHKSQFFTQRSEAQAYACGTRVRVRFKGQLGTIEKECFCGDWLHYEVRFDGDTSKYCMVLFHDDLEIE